MLQDVPLVTIRVRHPELPYENRFSTVREEQLGPHRLVPGSMLLMFLSLQLESQQLHKWFCSGSSNSSQLKEMGVRESWSPFKIILLKYQSRLYP